MASSASRIQQGVADVRDEGAGAVNNVTPLVNPHVSMPRPPSTGRKFEFGPFVYLPEQQRLLRGEATVALGNRAMDVLSALVERPGEVLSKDELMARVWPTTIVEEGNLKVHVAALRRALHDGLQDQNYIATVVGRGYRFVAPVLCSRASHDAGTTTTPTDASSTAQSLRPASASVIGRADLIEDVIGQLPSKRLISLVGPGGVGKTVVARAISEELTSRQRMDAAFVDLSSITDERLAISAIVQSAGLLLHPVHARLSLLNQIRDRSMLLVLDGCEGLLHTVASFVEKVVALAAGVMVLVTSREPLLVRGEHVLRMRPLSLPSAGGDFTLADILRHPAAELFVVRARAARLDLPLRDSEAQAISRICRRLDGLPLAIELAAGRVDAFGIHELERILDDGLELLNQGWRTAPGRHQTLEAITDWSYQFLSPPEQALLGRLSVFPWTFTLAAAESIAGGQGVDAVATAGLLANLVAKSLVMAETSSRPAVYRLLETTRCYALKRLEDEHESGLYQARYADYCRQDRVGVASDES
ncbi:ATP-binding protein [Dyella telluris]|uniref:Helix-turn-helix transcriptional regulator n=1 Tax=Dyella telluris TaxID=2763498 RepID=A0A7G8Q3K3_9GAMM|nr:winged helix-turn-helix domain-containing protein [Dyella telluris]QNK01361.1 helix-turn-helix transcriptional regulator [Dyella telluris]